MKKTLISTLAALLFLPSGTQAGEAGDLLQHHLYEGTAAKGLSTVQSLCNAGDPEGCFAAGLLTLVGGVEGLTADLYRYGASNPDLGSAGLLMGMGIEAPAGPTNPRPEPITYQALRAVLEDALAELDRAHDLFLQGGERGDYVVMLDPLRVRLDLDGDGTAAQGETLAAFLGPMEDFANISSPDAPPSGKVKQPVPPADTTLGLDRADALWFAGYTQVFAAQFDMALAHDFEALFDAYFHRVFPDSDLPLADHTSGGTLFSGPESDAALADLLAAVHTLNFPVKDKPRLANVLGRLQSISALSRRNWDAILAETDDNREMVPSPRQTSLVESHPVTEETVAAWMATLDTVDRVLAGELLVPHWRFDQGIDLRAYFETAETTDVVMILTGLGALPFLRDGPIADAESFAEANRVFGTQWLTYALWFN
jgi:hypothetical protein